MKKKLWSDTRLNSEELTFLHQAISVGERDKKNLAPGHILTGSVSRYTLIDKDNWFYDTVLKKLTERMFCQDWDVYKKYVVDQEEPLPKFEMNNFWVNYQKQYDYVSIHNHRGLYSFVVFMKIPTHWKEQHTPPMKLKFHPVPLPPSASDFQFVWSATGKETEEIVTQPLRLCSEDEGRILFFPAWLNHMVYPFYGTEEERVTISGNICLYDSNKPTEEQEIPVNEDEEKENDEKMIKILENNIRIMKKELNGLKKTREKDGIN